MTQKRHHPDEARAAGRSAISCYATLIDFIELVLDLVVSSTLALDAIHDGEW